MALGSGQSTAETSPCTGTAPLAAAVQGLSDELRDRIVIEFVGDNVLSKHYCLEPTWQKFLPLLNPEILNVAARPMRYRGQREYTGLGLHEEFVAACISRHPLWVPPAHLHGGWYTGATETCEACGHVPVQSCWHLRQLHRTAFLPIFLSVLLMFTVLLFVLGAPFAL